MLEPQNFMRPSENAASTLTTMVIATTHSVTIAVFFEKNHKIGLRQQNAELLERKTVGDDIGTIDR